MTTEQPADQTNPPVRDRFTKALVGSSGAHTLTRLLDALERELERTPWHRMRVIDIARDAGLSPAAFYTYFANIEAAFVELEARRQAAGIDPTRHMDLIAALLAWKPESDFA